MRARIWLGQDVETNVRLAGVDREVAVIERPLQPARIHCHYHGKELEGQQQVDGLQYVDHVARLATIQIVDVKDNALDPCFAALVGFLQLLLQLLEVLT